jgi:hypothetical protein
MEDFLLLSRAERMDREPIIKLVRFDSLPNLEVFVGALVTISPPRSFKWFLGDACGSFCHRINQANMLERIVIRQHDGVLVSIKNPVLRRIHTMSCVDTCRWLKRSNQFSPKDFLHWSDKIAAAYEQSVRDQKDLARWKSDFDAAYQKAVSDASRPSLPPIAPVG